MQTTLYGMAVLCVRISFIAVALTVGQHVRWNAIMKPMFKQYARGVYFLMSIAVGHIVGSCAITIIETLQQVMFSILK